MVDTFDCFVIGAGPGGYSAAIRLAQQGLKVAIAEKEHMGGTCLNVGCIPSKALLGSAHFLTIAKHAPLMGIDITTPKPNWPKIQSRKNAIVKGFRAGVAGLLKSNNVTIYTGTASASAPDTIEIQTADSTQTVTTKNIIIATGSQPVNIPAFPFDGDKIISSKEALSLPEVPASMVIIGGGVIGCELACVYAAMGTKVTIVEALDQVLPNEDEWVGKLMTKELKKQGIDSLTSKKVVAVDTASQKAIVKLEDGQSIEADKVLVAVGRKAVCDQKTIDALKLQTKGPALDVNEKMQTTIPTVYAIGDAVGTTYLAHGAFAEAEIAVANITGKNEKIGDYNLIPKAVYTFPEVASVGLNEKKCRQQNIDFVTGSAPFRSNGRSVAHNETIGQVNVIREKASDKILGVTIVGAAATEMIAAARALIGSSEKITDVSFAHPTVSEVLKEAWEDAFDLSIHVPPKK
jgi:dihydrolipoamide dehydrogenase